jgi:PTH1 family peptidyl-tRNA hydrolase
MIKLIVGLANPGPQYAKTRHNAGAWLIDALANQAEIELKAERKFYGALASIKLAGQSSRLFIPSTYMNLSGQAVQAIADFYQIAPEEILIVHDELDLSPGVARLKFDGGHGGHNGLRDIFEKLGTSKFYRIRIGIGKPVTQQKTVDFVLSPPSKDERELIDQSIEKSLSILPLLAQGENEKAMKELNTVK